MLSKFIKIKDKFKYAYRPIFSLLYIKIFHSPVSCLLFTKIKKINLNSIPYMHWTTSIKLKNLNEYIVPTNCKIYKIELDNIHNYLHDDLPKKVLLDLHSFEWINHVITVANKSVRKITKDQIELWINDFSSVGKYSWEPVVSAKRIFNWLNFYFIIKSSENELKKSFVNSISKQVRYLYLIRNISHDIYAMSYIYKALIYYAISSGNIRLNNKLMEEFNYILELNHAGIKEKDTHEIVDILKNLLCIRSVLSAERNDFNINFTKFIMRLSSIINYIKKSDGICIFHGRFTPSMEYINKILLSSGLVNELNIDNCRFFKSSSFGSEIFIDKESSNFPFEFNFSNCNISISNHLNFKTFSEKHECTKHKNGMFNYEYDRGYFLFKGNSTNEYECGNIAFSRRLYMNNLGTELRGEDISSSDFSLSVINEFMISDDVDVISMMYQNGVNIESKNGKKWLLNVSSNIDITSSKNEKIINGQVITVTIIRMETYKGESKDLVCKWCLKEV